MFPHSQVTVVGVSGGVSSPPSNALVIVTGPEGSPGVTGIATAPTVATIVVTPPPGTWDAYDITMCPVSGPATACVSSTCANPQQCMVPGLLPGKTYSFSSVARSSVSGATSPRSNEGQVTTLNTMG